MIHSGEQLVSDISEDVFNDDSVTGTIKQLKKINTLPIRNFHLVIWDKVERKLLAFRDHLGVCPLILFRG